jgi:DNA gyrase/topoisomerase IV subunit A
MSDRTGLNLVEQYLLEVIDELGAGPKTAHRKSAGILQEAYARHGVPPVYGYDTLCALASRAKVHLVLIDGHGNLGSEEDAPANSRYTEARLSPAGALAVACEHGALPRLPIGLVNGDLHFGGTAPAFDPARVVTAVLRAGDDATASDEELIDLVGPPSFPRGCSVAGDFAALAAGAPAELQLAAHVTVEEDEPRAVIVVTDPPPGVSTTNMRGAIANRVSTAAQLDQRSAKIARRVGIPLRDVRDESRGDTVRIVCVPRRTADLDECVEKVRQTWPVTNTIKALLPRPLAPTIRSIAEAPDVQRPALEALLRDS